MNKAAEIILRRCLDLKKGESCLVITDEEKRDIGEVIFKEGKKFTEDVFMEEIPVLDFNGQEPSPEVKEMMKDFEVIIIVTEKSLTHTVAVKEAKQNARIASMPGITEEVMKRAIDVDYEKMKGEGKRLKKRLDEGTLVRVEGENFELRFSIEGREAVIDDGLMVEKGKTGNLPAGEVFIAPVEGSGHGKVIFDKSFAGLGLLEEEMEIVFKEGIAVEINGFKHRELKKMLVETSNKGAFNLAEFGIGLNPKAKVSGVVLEDEKVKGTMHLALGSNFGFGGNVEGGIHLDGVLRKPKIFIDGEKLTI